MNVLYWDASSLFTSVMRQRTFALTPTRKRILITLKSGPASSSYDISTLRRHEGAGSIIPMSITGRFAILIDGGFVRWKLQKKHSHFPTAQELCAECDRIKAHDRLKELSLLRIYFYDAAPASGTLTNPIDGSVIDLATTSIHTQCTSLHQAIELLPDFALRQGVAAVHGWTFGEKAMESLATRPRVPVAKDLVPNIEQKGVDLRIGLDIARLSLQRLVDVIVVVTGDSDLVPAFKFARREGTRIYLDYMGHGVRRELKVHADIVL